jgi:uncharacterized protein
VTAFEELCQEWVLHQARQGKFPFAMEQVGSHWDSQVQVDVAAINWREKALLLGEAKWQPDAVGRAVVRELIEEKTARVKAALPDGGEGWRFFYAFFSRAGFTDTAQQLAEEYQAQLVDLARLDRDLAED